MSIFGGIGQAATRGLKTYLTLQDLYKQRKEAKRNQTLQLVLSLFGASDESRPALQSTYEKLGFKLPTDIQFPARTKPIGERAAKEVLAGKPELLAKLPPELHDQPWNYVLQVRPDLGRTLYGVEPDVKQKAAEIIDRYKEQESRYGRKLPYTPEDRAILQQAGYIIPMRKEPVVDRVPIVQGAPGQRDPKIGEPVGPRVLEIPTGEREVEDLPQGEVDYVVTIPGLGQRRWSELPAQTKDFLVRRAFTEADSVTITLSDGGVIRVPRDKAIDHIISLDKENRLRSWTVNLPDGTKLSGLTAGEFISLYNAQAGRDVALRGQDITARGQDIGAQNRGSTRPAAQIQSDIASSGAKLQQLEAMAKKYPDEQEMSLMNPELAAQLTRERAKLAGLQAELKYVQSQGAAAPLPPVPPRPGQQPAPGAQPAGGGTGASAVPARSGDYLAQVQQAIFEAEGGTKAKTPYGYAATSNPTMFGADPWTARGRYDQAVTAELSGEWKKWVNSPERTQGWDFIRWLARKGYNANPAEWDNWERNVRARLESSAGQTASDASQRQKGETLKKIAMLDADDRQTLATWKQAGKPWTEVEQQLRQAGINDPNVIQAAYQVYSETDQGVQRVEEGGLSVRLSKRQPVKDMTQENVQAVTQAVSAPFRMPSMQPHESSVMQAARAGRPFPEAQLRSAGLTAKQIARLRRAYNANFRRR